ncbi:MAG: GTP 3',8-cyclase MoaA, partial [Lachnospiraceae bacterium]|nr:GTP 3',8-cyclase MoaA [Lachnospiraceae bacterium]
DINSAGIEEVALLAKDDPVDVRFIELMPLGCGKGYDGVESDELLCRLEERFGRAESLRSETGVGPACYYRFAGFQGRIGFISPLSHQFCHACNRVRLTSDGFLKLCLQYPDGVDLKTPLRGGCTDDELADLIGEAIRRKPAAHAFRDAAGLCEERKMVQIGG